MNRSQARCDAWHFSILDLAVMTDETSTAHDNGSGHPNISANPTAFQ